MKMRGFGEVRIAFVFREGRGGRGMKGSSRGFAVFLLEVAGEEARGAYI